VPTRSGCALEPSLGKRASIPRVRPAPGEVALDTAFTGGDIIASQRILRALRGG
jgi:hypothetical protein